MKNVILRTTFPQGKIIPFVFSPIWDVLTSCCELHPHEWATHEILSQNYGETRFGAKYLGNTTMHTGCCRICEFLRCYVRFFLLRITTHVDQGCYDQWSVRHLKRKIKHIDYAYFTCCVVPQSSYLCSLFSIICSAEKKYNNDSCVNVYDHKTGKRASTYFHSADNMYSAVTEYIIFRQVQW